MERLPENNSNSLRSCRNAEKIERVRLYDRTPRAVSEAIRICVERGILKEYLESRELEVVTMMIDLYDQDRILKTHIENEKRMAAEEAAEKDKKSIICRMLRLGKLTTEEIAVCGGVSVNKVHEIEMSMLQEA